MPPTEVREGTEAATLSRAKGSDEAFALLSDLPSYDDPAAQDQ